jgi:hypothetical protein
MTGENSNQTIKKQTRLVARPAAVLTAGSTCRGHPREINSLPTYWLAGLSEYNSSRKRQWFFENIFFAPWSRGRIFVARVLEPACYQHSRTSTRKLEKNRPVKILFRSREKAGEKATKTGIRDAVFFEPASGFAPRMRRRGLHSCSASRVPSHFRQTLFTCRRRGGLIAGYGIQIL